MTVFQNVGMGIDAMAPACVTARSKSGGAPPGTQDHTLVNSVKFSEVAAGLGARLVALQAAAAREAASSERRLHQLHPIQMWTKLRPGVRAFLASMAPLFELWIHTNGSRRAPLSLGAWMLNHLQRPRHTWTHTILLLFIELHACISAGICASWCL